MKHIIYMIILLGIVYSCSTPPTPKPRGYFRIGFPEKEYSLTPDALPYQFYRPNYSIIEPYNDPHTGPYDITIRIPENKADIHLSYKQIKGNLAAYTEESRKLAYNHTIKASSIQERLYVNNDQKVFGTIYHIKGNAASPMQFYLTDSAKHFLRGALYIREVPNYDSLQPVIKFIEQDIVKMIETTQWK
ncbi:gliding motility lipoprotein GldD [Puteibacter caeruleilacunae]|nr:gliding motility lipoprotein GldD [Puteibacter caeruleilacunae]